MPLMDEVERQRFLESLRNDADFREAVQRELLTQELLDLPQTASMLIEHQAEMQTSLTALARDVESLTGRVQVLTGQVELLTGQVELLTGQVQVLTGQVEVLIRHQADLQRALTSLSDLVGDALANVRVRFEEVESAIASLRTDMNNGFTGVGGRFDQLDAAISELRNERGR